MSEGQLLLTMNFRDGTMMLNEGILEALGRPKQVQIMLNEEAKRLLLRPCGIDSDQAVVLPSEHEVLAEVGAKRILRRLGKLAGWETEQPRICIGEEIKEYQAVCFDLTRSMTVM